jgi:hypothetical protein
MLLNISTWIGTISPATLSFNGGRVVLAGSGLPAAWPNTNYALTIKSGNSVVAPNVFSTNPSALTLLLPASSSSYTITLISPLGSKITKTVSVSLGNTPNLTLSSTPTVSSGTNSLSFTKSNLLTSIPTFV